ncbi:MAG: hypothetical protein J0H12_00760 [Candidatus Paracaedimonas acanthamoebae]|uniref:MotA/TolQ/ExbB proton channel domain-containing protein n=1 Tax=Candidatus Paracaedimonas acanthamoebae TaxID=244581 RepID=A0A8J7PVA2_9PROT|nr:hypothetical protein [Candidatus Paracaedimonas acanthamoebae]
MSKFKKVVCYCLIYSIFLNNLLTSFTNTAYASDITEDITIDEASPSVSTPQGTMIEEEQTIQIPAKQAIIEEEITKTWKRKHTLSDFSLNCSTILHVILFGFSILLGLMALNSFEALSAKTLFPAIGIGHVGVGTEKPFYEATAATHGIIFAGLVPTIYTFFKFGKGLIDNGTLLVSKLKSRCQKQKPVDSEKGPAPENDQEKLTKAKKQVFRKWPMPQFLGYLIPGGINIGAALTYSLITVVNLYQTEMPRFPIFFKTMFPFLIIMTFPDKCMTGHGAIKEMLEWVAQKLNRKVTQRQNALKEKIEGFRQYVENLDLEDPRDRNTLRNLIKNLLPEDETISILNEEPEELGTIPPSTRNDTDLRATMELSEESDQDLDTQQKGISTQGKDEATSSSTIDGTDLIPIIGSPEESGQGSATSLNSQIDTSKREGPSFQEKDFVESGVSPIAYEKLYDFIREYPISSHTDLGSKISRYLSYGISFLGAWGLSTVLTQDLETIFKIGEKYLAFMAPDQRIILATVIGSLAAGWIAFAEKGDIYKTLKSFETSFTSQFFIKKTNGTRTDSVCHPRSLKHVLKFTANILLYKSFLALTAVVFTFSEFSSYRNTRKEPYENIFTRTNDNIPAIKYIGLIALYLFEIPSYMAVQERGYNAVSRRLKQATIWSKSLSSYQEKLIGILEVMSKQINDLTPEGLTVLEQKTFPDHNRNVQVEEVEDDLAFLTLPHQTMSSSKWQRFKQWMKDCFPPDIQDSDEAVSLLVNQSSDEESSMLNGEN